MSNREYFRPYFDESLEQYVRRNSRADQWAGQPELYALSELYNKRIEVYQEGEIQQPTFTMNEDFAQVDVLRLSYHGRSHYNVVYDPNNRRPVGDGRFNEVKIRDYRPLF